MKLQISFDMTNLEKALSIASEVAPFADILEVGTLLLYANGVKAIEEFRVTFPEKTLLTDAKIIDRGKESAELLAKADTDWFTVMAGTNKDTIYTACNTARANNRKVMLDLLDTSSIGQSALDAKTFGADALLFHQPFDEKAALTFLDRWEMARGNTDLPIYISGNIKREIIEEVIAVKPNGVIIGRAITESEHPAQEAEFFRSLLNQAQ